MKREGLQHGVLWSYTILLTLLFQWRYERQMESASVAGLFTKVSATGVLAHLASDQSYEDGYKDAVGDDYDYDYNYDYDYDYDYDCDYDYDYDYGYDYGYDYA